MQTVDIEKDELLTLHFKKSAQLVLIKAKHMAENASLFIQHDKDVYHLDRLSSRSVSGVFHTDGLSSHPFSYSLTVLEPGRDRTNPGTNIESVHDMEWREQKFEPKKLLQYYKMLSKIRLTGENTECAFCFSSLVLFLKILSTLGTFCDIKVNK